MREANSIQWKRLSVEAAAIVASILLAFAIDAWWAEQQDRRAEIEILSRLHKEFTLNRDGIGAMGTQSRVQVASVELFRLLEANSNRDEPLVIQNALINQSTITPTVDPVTPVLDGLILSGRLDVIRDEDVLIAITNWQRWVKNVAEFEAKAGEFARSQMVPALTKRGHMGTALRHRRERPDGETSVIVDDELVGIVSFRAAEADFILGALERMKNSASELLSAIEHAQTQ
jgi:hypothetical protein